MLVKSSKFFELVKITVIEITHYFLLFLPYFTHLFTVLSQKILQKRIHFLQYFFIQAADLVYH